MPWELFCELDGGSLDALTNRSQVAKRCRCYQPAEQHRNLSRSCVWCVKSDVRPVDTKERVRVQGGPLNGPGRWR